MKKLFIKALKNKFDMDKADAISLAKTIESMKRFKGKTAEGIKKYIEERNPEKGRFSIMRNTIELKTESPVIGEKDKNGIIEVGSFSFSMQLINTPRLTFIRQKPE